MSDVPSRVPAAITDPRDPSRPALRAVAEAGASAEPHCCYDSEGQLTAIIASDWSVTTFDYDEGGNLAGVTDPGGNTTEFVYDEEGRLVQETDSAGASKSFVYNEDGDLVRYIDCEKEKGTHPILFGTIVAVGAWARKSCRRRDGGRIDMHWEEAGGRGAVPAFSAQRQEPRLAGQTRWHQPSAAFSFARWASNSSSSARPMK